MNKKPRILEVRKIAAQGLFTFANVKIVAFIFTPIMSLFFSMLSNLEKFKSEFFEQLMFSAVISLSCFFIVGLLALPFFLLYKFRWKNNTIDEIQVYDDQLTYVKGDKKYRLDFCKIKHVCVNFMGTIKIKMTNKKSHYIGRYVERSEYILESINTFNSRLIKDNNFNEFHEMLVFNDHKNAIKENIYKNKFGQHGTSLYLMSSPFLFSAMVYAFFPQDFTVTSVNQYLSDITTDIVISHFVITFLIIYFGKTHMAKSALKRIKKTGKKIRDIHYENETINKMMAIHFGIMLVVGAIAFSFKDSYLTMRLTVNQSKEVNYFLKRYNIKHKNREVLIDKRFNCRSCKYNLEIGDAIVLVAKGNRLGRIIKLPGTEGKFQSFNSKANRYLASEGLQKVPLNHFGVLLDDGTTRVLTKQDNIYGKVISFDK